LFRDRWVESGVSAGHQEPSKRAVDGFVSNNAEIESPHHVHQHGMVVTAFFFIFRQAPVVFMVGFALPLADFGVQLSLFLSLIALGNCLIVNGNQAIVGRAVNHQNFVGLYGRRPVVLALDVALLERISGRQVPVGFNSLHGSLDDLLGVRLRGGRAAPYGNGQQEEKSHRAP
jgi:hypothetical protein